MIHDVTISRQPLSALFDLKGTPEALRAHAGDALPGFPARPNTRESGDAAELCHLGPGRWLLRAPIDREPALEAALRPAAAPPDVSIVRVSDTLTFFTVTGPDAAQVMAVATPLDLHPAAFTDRDISYTEAFGLKALVARCDGGFELAVEQSYGDMVETFLARIAG